MNPQKTQILVLDDEPDIQDEINNFLTINDIEVHEANTPIEAIRVLSGNRIDIVILYIQLPEMNGSDVLKDQKLRNPKIFIIEMSGDRDSDSVINAIWLEAFDYLNKPYPGHEPFIAVEKARLCTFNFILSNQYHFN
jgi:DNA-binding NtrC family response regulator